MEFNSLEQEVNADRESWLERANIHLEILLDKADKEEALLKHMAFHYMARNKVCKGMNQEFKGKIKEGIKEAKEAKRE